MSRELDEDLRQTGPVGGLVGSKRGSSLLRWRLQLFLLCWFFGAAAGAPGQKCSVVLAHGPFLLSSILVGLSLRVFAGPLDVFLSV